MAAWLIPALKIVLPHIGTIVATASPVFTKKGAGAALVQKQIDELQIAASENAKNIKALAEQLRTTVSALEEAAAIAEARLQRATFIAAAAMAITGISLVAAIVLIFAG